MLKQVLGWIWFAIVQILCVSVAVIGWVILIPFCLTEAWVSDDISIKDSRPIDRWKWKPIGWLFGNPEDGVSGQYAVIWVNGSRQHYMPDAWAPWRAYCWSAWRNSADQLKYLFAWQNGPYKEFILFGVTHKIGWQTENGFKVPVLS